MIQKKRPTTREILESNWLNELNDLSSQEREKLEKDVLNKLKNLYKEIKDSDLRIIIRDNIIKEKKLTTKGYNSENSNAYLIQMWSQNIFLKIELILIILLK